MVSTLNWDVYNRLRTLDISDSTIPDPEIAHRTFRLGQAASWARWGENTYDLSPITATTPEQFENLKPLTTSIVLFAINWGGTHAPEHFADWQNFHTKGHRGDSTLRNSIGGIVDKAPYMTDVFKLVPTPRAADLDKKIRADARLGHNHVQRCANILRQELQLCTEGNGGRPPVLVAMGKAAFEWLSGPFAQVIESAPVERMPHYTCGAGSNAARARALTDIITRTT